MGKAQDLKYSFEYDSHEKNSWNPVMDEMMQGRIYREKNMGNNRI